MWEEWGGGIRGVGREVEIRWNVCVSGDGEFLGKFLGW